MATTPPFELYAFWRSSAAFWVQVALAMKGMLAADFPVLITPRVMNYFGTTSGDNYAASCA
jgi:hypothetical protein